MFTVKKLNRMPTTEESEIGKSDVGNIRSLFLFNCFLIEV